MKAKVVTIRDIFNRKLTIDKSFYKHIKDRHPEILELDFSYIEETVKNPDMVKTSFYSFNTSLYYKYYEELKTYLVVVAKRCKRNYIYTSYKSNSVHNTKGTVKYRGGHSSLQNEMRGVSYN